MSDIKKSAEAKQRLSTMVETTDGFKIAEADLKLRGPGELEGTAQSGILDLKIGDLSKDTQILAEARTMAQWVLDQDADFKLPENAPIAQFEALYKKTAKWGRIS